jgi:hypothetical protein
VVFRATPNQEKTILVYGGISFQQVEIFLRHLAWAGCCANLEIVWWLIIHKHCSGLNIIKSATSKGEPALIGRCPLVAVAFVLFHSLGLPLIEQDSQ